MGIILVHSYQMAITLAVVIFLFDNLSEKGSVPWLNSQGLHVLKTLWHGENSWDRLQSRVRNWTEKVENVTLLWQNVSPITPAAQIGNVGVILNSSYLFPLPPPTEPCWVHVLSSPSVSFHAQAAFCPWMAIFSPQKAGTYSMSLLLLVPAGSYSSHHL